MNIELIAIGDEVLLGFTVNSNAAFLAQRLLEAGFTTIRHEVIGDDKEAMRATIKSALKRGSCVIVTGGLGPTCDDLTREVVASLFQRKQVLDLKLLDRLNREFHHPSTAENQALVPEGAHLFENHFGTASGFLLQDEALFANAMLICLPGVPQEMRHVCTEQLLPYLQKLEHRQKMYVHAIHLAGLKEADVDPLLRELSCEGVSLGIYPSQGTLTVHIKKEAESEAVFLKQIDPVRQAIITRFGKHVFDAPSGKIEEAVHHILIEKGLTLATAESCTGGALAARFTALADASKYFQGSVIAYSNEVKKSHLQVTDKMLATYGAVSEEVTECMAQSVRSSMHADIAIATSGIFGPSGATVKKPVGTVCATIASGTKTHSWTMHLTQHRELNCERTILRAISELLFFLKS